MCVHIKRRPSKLTFNWIALLTSNTVAVGQQTTQNNYIKNLFTVLKCSCQGGASQVGFVGPYFCEESGAGVTVDSESYAKTRDYTVTCIVINRVLQFPL